MILVLTQDADADIDDIFEYSISTFGVKQAEKYYLALRDRVEEIANGFVHSTDCSHVKEGLRRANYESHAIYYRVEGEKVIILRILGQQQDTARHIN